MTEIIHINDVFWTVQGEGANAGRRALFVRMPWCNLACSWCDTTFNTFKKWTSTELGKFALLEASRFAVLTGGEPMMNKDSPKVVKILQDCGFMVACETNGCFRIIEDIDFVTVSPKRDACYKIHPSAWERADEFKYVIDAGFDFSILDRHNEEHARGRKTRLSLSPEFNTFKESLEQIFAYQKLNPNWRISLQTHKTMGIA